MLLPIPPNRRDIEDSELAREGFPGSWGTYFEGERLSPTTDNAQLWFGIEVSLEEMVALWRHMGMSETHSQSAFPKLFEAKRLTISVQFFKAMTGIFKRRWIGNVLFEYEPDSPVDRGGQVYVGSIAAETQSQMWRFFREFLEFRRKLHEDTQSAIASLR